MSEKVLDESTALLEQFANREYEHGWETTIETETIEPGLNEDTVRRISAKKNEPQWLLDLSPVRFRRATRRTFHW